MRRGEDGARGKRGLNGPTNGVNLAQYAVARTTTRNAAGNSYGNCFYVMADCVATSIHFFHKASGTESIKVSIWSSAGVRLTSEIVSVSADGLVTATLSTPQALTAGQTIKVVCLNQTNNITVSVTAGSFDNFGQSTVLVVGPHLVRTSGIQGSGDTNPLTLIGFFPVHLVTEDA